MDAKAEEMREELQKLHLVTLYARETIENANKTLVPYLGANIHDLRAACARAVNVRVAMFERTIAVLEEYQRMDREEEAGEAQPPELHEFIPDDENPGPDIDMDGNYINDVGADIMPVIPSGLPPVDDTIVESTEIDFTPVDGTGLTDVDDQPADVWED